MKTEYHILNLGAGVQSSALYLLDADGELADLEEGPVKFDFAIFADVQDEPKAVGEHLQWLGTQSDVPILDGTAGCVGDHVAQGLNSTGQPFCTIPAYTRIGGGPVGQTRRQCTMEYKVRVVERIIRRDILGLAPKKHVPKGIHIWQYIGYSLDEPGRAARARGRFAQRGWNDVRFPLIEERMTRADCVRYLEGGGASAARSASFRLCVLSV